MKRYVIVDIDSTIATDARRAHILNGEGRPTSAQWDAFFDACDTDEPLYAGIEHVEAVTCSLSPEVYSTFVLMFLTGRPERIRGKTDAWLRINFPGYADLAGTGRTELSMRADDDRTSNATFKMSRVLAVLNRGDEVLHLVDDNDDAVDRFVKGGLSVSHVVTEGGKTKVVGPVYLSRLHEALSLKSQFVYENVEAFERAAHLIAGCAGGDGRSHRRTVFACGNGGSATDASHFVGELVGRFSREREPIGAHVLASDPATMTAVANDYGYDDVFARPVRASAIPGDVLVCFSTSGRSPNVVSAAKEAALYGVRVVAFVGPRDSELAKAADVVIAVDDSPDSARTQECHIFGVHLVCERVDEILTRAPATAVSRLTTRTSPRP